MTSVFPALPSTASSEALARAGFTPVAGGRYERSEFLLTVGAHWCVLEASSSAVVNGAHGLWKRIGASVDARRIFALPRRIWNDAASADASFNVDTTVLDQCLQWAFDSAARSVSSDWQSPTRAEVESWFKPDQLTVVAGSLLRQGEVICESDQLAIRFPLVPELPPDLPQSRRAWLRALLDEAQERWHLVRLDVLTDADGQSSVVAEVDLTGVPHELAEDLFVISLEALRWVVQWMGETTDWLADATVASEILAVCPNNQTQKSP